MRWCFALLLLVCGACDDCSGGSAPDALLETQPGWLFEGAERCPADVWPDDMVMPPVSPPERCSGEAFGTCVAGCEGGSADACFFAGYAAQQSEKEDLAMALYLKGCELGHPVSCTNAAASRQPTDTCTMRSLDALCDEQEEAWACATLAVHLLSTDPLGNEERARAALDVACDDPNHPACVESSRVREALDQRAQ